MTKQKVLLTNGTEVAYLERPGSGERLVLLHGITDNALSYEPLLADIDTSAHVYAMDFRGHGASAQPDSGYDTEAYADDVRCFIAEVAGAPVMLSGHSLGGVVAMQVARTAPDLVTRLMLEDPPVYFVNNLNDTYRTLFEGVVVMSQTLRDGSQSREDWFDVMANAPDPYNGKPGIETMGADLINFRLDSIAQMTPKAMQDALAGSLEWDSDAALAGIQCPWTMLVGDEALGAVVSTEEASRIELEHAANRVVRVAGVGHLIHSLKPQAWVEAINEMVSA